MKNKFILALSLTALLTTFVGCGNKAEQETNTNTIVEENDTELSAEKNLFNVEVTLPASFFEGQDVSTIESEAKAEGVHDVKLNEDGSLTYKMDKSTHKKLLNDLKLSIDDSITDILSDKESTPSFTNITYNDTVTEFNIYVDSSTFNPFEAFTAIGFYMLGNVYQAMDCVETDKINTTVNFIDKDTNEIIDSGNSSDLNSTEE